MTFSRPRLMAFVGTGVTLLLVWLFPEVKQEIRTLTQLWMTTTESTHGTSTVTRVVDGDTVVLETGETVRLIGVDAPESVKPDSRVECFGKEASTWLRTTLEGKVVSLERDTHDRDRYQRLLRYVVLDTVLINELLVREGYARAVRYPPDTRHAERFERAEQQARAEGIGIWDEKQCPS